MRYGVVLAGGFSSRATCNKMVLKMDDDYMINKTIQSMLPFVDEVIVVSGHYHKDIVYAVKEWKHVTVVRNEFYGHGMFSSVKTGVKETFGDFFIVPGDCPFVCEEVYEALLMAQGEIRVPTYNGLKGHPIFLSGSLKQHLLDFDDDSHLKAFRDTKEVTYVTTNCPGILKDIDTLEDYKTEVERMKRDEVK